MVLWAGGAASDWLRTRCPRADAWAAGLHGIVVRFDFRQAIDHLLLAWGFDALGQMPAGLGKMRALENGQCGSEADGGWRVWVVEQVAERFDGAGCEVAHAVLKGFDIFALGFLEGCCEDGLGPEPVVNCGAV